MKLIEMSSKAHYSLQRKGMQLVIPECFQKFPTTQFAL